MAPLPRGCGATGGIVLGESVRRRQRGGRRSSPFRPFRWKSLLIVLPFALLLPFLIGYLIAIYVVFPAPAVTGVGIPVPELVGRSALEARQELAVAGLGELQTTELPHPSAPAGQVVAQSPLPGQQLRSGAGVRVAVSAGRPRTTVPDVSGFGADRAEVMLRRSGFDPQRVMEEHALAAGRVIRTEPAAGEERMLPATVTVIISSGPPPPADTLPPDTLPAGLPEGR
jgi:hypothetical protein